MDSLSSSNANGVTTQYEYDSTGRKVRTRINGRIAEETSYDGEGATTVSVNADGISQSYTIDALGRVSQRSVTGGAETNTFERTGRGASPAMATTGWAG